MKFDKKKAAALAAAVLTAIAGVLTQCPDDAPAPRQGTTVASPDAGADTLTH